MELKLETHRGFGIDQNAWYWNPKRDLGFLAPADQNRGLRETYTDLEVLTLSRRVSVRIEEEQSEAKDVIVERFCMGSCGFHDSIILSTKSKVVVAHVGDLSLQCPGLCAWPYAVPAYGPPGQALVALNGVGTDGLVTGSASNPFNNGYYQGDALAPLEAVTACPGIFGAGTYPGFPGNLVVDRISKASFNAFGLMAENFFFLRCGIPRA
nr:protein EXORDIUM-like 2 [Ziziphus jujuba var. spinosa]